MENISYSLSLEAGKMMELREKWSGGIRKTQKREGEPAREKHGNSLSSKRIENRKNRQYV